MLTAFNAGRSGLCSTGLLQHVLCTPSRGKDQLPVGSLQLMCPADTSTLGPVELTRLCLAGAGSCRAAWSSAAHLTGSCRQWSPCSCGITSMCTP